MEHAGSSQPIAEPPAELVGRLAARGYQLGALVAAGGMGLIYRARDVELDRDVVIKLPRSTEPGLLHRFRREVYITARLQHPGVVPILAAGSLDDGLPFYVMRFVTGRPFADVLAEATTTDERLSHLGALISAVETVAYAHSQGVLHRDLKPHNVLVGAFGEVLVIDWGLAKLLEPPTADDAGGTVRDLPIDPELDAEISSNPVTGRPRPSAGTIALAATEVAPAPEPDTLETKAGDVLGTPAYMAPEQAFGGDVGRQSDVYSLGVMLFELLAGQRPSPALAGPVVQLPSDAPAELVAIARRATAMLREERYPDAAALRDELVRYRTGKLVAAYRYKPQDHVRRFLSRNRIAAAITIVALAVVIAIGATALLRVRAARDRAERQRGASERLANYLLDDLSDRLRAVGRIDVLDRIGTRVASYYGDPGLVDDVAAQASWADALGVQRDAAADSSDLELARRYATQALERAEAAHAREPSPVTTIALGGALDGLARVELSRGEPEVAQPLYDRCLALLAAETSVLGRLAWSNCALDRSDAEASRTTLRRELLDGILRRSTDVEALPEPTQQSRMRRLRVAALMRTYGQFPVEHPSALLDEAIRLIDAALAEAPYDVRVLQEQIDVNHERALTLLGDGNNADAEVALTVAQRACDRLTLIEPRDVDSFTLAVVNATLRAQLRVAEGRADEARALLDGQKARLEQGMKTAGSDPWMLDVVAHATTTFGEVQRSLDDVDGAAHNYEVALELVRRAEAKFATSARLIVDVDLDQRLAVLAAERGDLATAEQHLTSSEATVTRGEHAYPDDDRWPSARHEQFMTTGFVRAQGKRFAEARQALEAALAQGRARQDVGVVGKTWRVNTAVAAVQVAQARYLMGAASAEIDAAVADARQLVDAIDADHVGPFERQNLEMARRDLGELEAEAAKRTPPR